MDIGNVIAVLLPLPLGILWLGVSVLLYALYRHHPNPKVGHYTRRAAYRLYGVVVAILPIVLLFPGEGINHWLVAWGVAALILIPWSLWSLARIRGDHWQDVVAPTEETADV